MPLFGGWITNSAAGTQVPVYTNAVSGLFGGTTATTSATTWYRDSLISQQTSTVTSSNANRWITWLQWEDDVEHSQYMALAQQRAVQTMRRTEEQQREFEERRMRRQQVELRLAQERSVALQRSKELLLGHLTAKQRETFEANKWFVVEGGKSKQLYRIRDKGSYSGNIDVLEGKPGKVTHRLCCHLSDHRVPLYDHLLAQKVWIEHDEDDFLRQANIHAA